MSLRLASLDPNEPRAAKDCRTCNRRRIRCDRSLPTCKKCDLKELKCPGYGLRIQWDQGVASRGKLTGKALPVLEPASAHQIEDGFNFDQPPWSSGVTGSGFLVGHSSDGLTPVSGRIPSLDRPSSDAPSTPGQILDYLQDPSVQELIHHYDREVAPIMPWVDGPNNNWRNIMLPLASRSPSLLMAILALAAEHYSSQRGSIWINTYGQNSTYFRDQSLRLLADDLRAETSAATNTPSEDTASAMLATILVLCNLEMVRSESALWTVHWQAARTITTRWTCALHPVTELGPVARFLIKEAFVYDVFASSTTFDTSDYIPGSLLREEDHGVFIDWLQLVQEVTHYERRNFPRVKGDGTGHQLENVTVLHHRFDHARRRTLHFSRALNLASPQLEKGFAILVDIFHHAGLLYSFQALYAKDHFVLAKQELVRNTVAAITQIGSSDAFQHDFVWPLFILGTESRHDKQLQEYVETRTLQATKSTAFSNCYPVLEFLQRFWKTDPTVVVDWMDYARQECGRGFTFLVI